MDEQQATAVAEALGGETWQSGGGMWLVIVRRTDGRRSRLWSESGGRRFGTQDNPTVTLATCGMGPRTLRQALPVSKSHVLERSTRTCCGADPNGAEMRQSSRDPVSTQRVTRRDKT